MNQARVASVVLLAVLALVPRTDAAARDVMIRSVDFSSQVLELHNFGPKSVDLSGWRFCSHDENELRRYSASTGLNSRILVSGESLFVHFLDDAPASPDRIGISTIGGNFATPIDAGPFAIQIYFSPVSFNNGATIADHVQWSIGGVGNASADERSDEAQAGGVWTNQSLWVSTAADSTGIELAEGSEATVLHGPSDYVVLGGAVAGGAITTPLTVEKVAGVDVRLRWGPSCAAGDSDFGVYEGTIGGAFDSHTSVMCSTGGVTLLDLTPGSGSVYWLVVPNGSVVEGSYGTGNGLPRVQGGGACASQNISVCP